MPTAHIAHSVTVKRTPRVRQLEGIFDLPPTTKSETSLTADLPLEAHPWNIGLIVGPSGCGKSSVARELFGDHMIHGFDWPTDQSLVDAFPKGMSIKEITGLLSSVGFSSPPNWLRPFRCLSNGEQFRATIARALAESPELAVVDEFTSVVDRTVAKIGSAAVAKTIRRRATESDQPVRFIAVACHDDLVDWLDPDWIFEPHRNAFHWRRERQPRPDIPLTVRRVDSSAWQLFKHHHYLSGQLSKSATCFVGCVDGRPACFVSVIHFPHPQVSSFREHRTVCLPDFQGVGIGNRLSEFVASLYRSIGETFISTTSSPAMIAHRARSPLWNMHRKPGFVECSNSANAGQRHSVDRITAGFSYVGPPADLATAEALLFPGLTESLDQLERYPHATLPLLTRKTAVPGNYLKRALDRLVETGRIIRAGRGGRHDAYAFSLAQETLRPCLNSSTPATSPMPPETPPAASPMPPASALAGKPARSRKRTAPAKNPTAVSSKR